eukprot:3431374-Prymnesium_polylepis.1
MFESLDTGRVFGIGSGERSAAGSGPRNVVRGGAREDGCTRAVRWWRWRIWCRGRDEVPTV